MTDRIKVNAMDNDTTKWPSWTAQGAATTYAQAGALVNSPMHPTS